jgi:hypothetical protein
MAVAVLNYDQVITESVEVGQEVAPVQDNKMRFPFF